MTDIPRDIQETAEGVVFGICGDHSMTLMGDVENMVEPIAIAILAERNRCESLVFLSTRGSPEQPSELHKLVAECTRSSGEILAKHIRIGSKASGGAA